LDHLEKVYKHIDRNIDAHVEGMRRLLMQPSVSQTGEGMQECAGKLKDWLKDLGCKNVELAKPEFNWPIVYGEYDANAPKTLIAYGMYDVQPVEEADQWKVPPFAGRIVEMPPFKKVVMNRGATNTKGPMAAFLNAFESVQQAAGELPVNVLFVLEGEEEQGSVSMPKFVRDYQQRLKRADGVFFPISSQERNGLANPLLGSEGLLYVELETNGGFWGRGPTQFGVHGAMKRILDSPAWRHIKMLSSLVSDDGNSSMVKGFYDDIAVPSKEDLRLIEKGYRKSLPALEAFDPEIIKQSLKVERFKGDLDDPEEILKEQLFSSSFNLDGIWGGWTGPGTKTLLPHKVTSKHNIRLVPNQSLDDIYRKIRAHLDEHGYKDVELRWLAGYPWALVDHRNPVAEAMYDVYEEFNVKYSISPPVANPVYTSPAWPAYLFAGEPLRLPIVGGALGHGDLAHSPNEYFVVEGCDAKYGRVHGLAGCEKSMASVLFHFAAR
jgi:acetylornithine deacetylase/succinyl-diaminopimelate desuccinylase-like protein